MKRKAARRSAGRMQKVRLSAHAAELLDIDRFDRRVSKIVKATYDAAQTTDRNENLWATASGRSADAEATAAIRATIRNRCRYEARNNSYCRGMIDTKANDIVGRMPRLQLVTDNADYNERKEAVFNAWAQEVRLGEKMRMAMVARMESGEIFLVLKNNPALRSAVKLDIVMVEAERVCAQYDKAPSDRYQDGITYDEFGNPVSYDILRYHPGGLYSGGGGATGYDTVPASQVIHIFRATRPGQRRGVPDIAPALNLFGMIRRYTLAVVSAAEAAANAAWVLVSKSPNVEPVDIDPMDSINLSMGSGLTMPAGWGIEQIKAEQPTTTHTDFKRNSLNEAFRCINMPLNVGLGDSSQYNYASGRLDFQVYFRDIMVNRYDLGVVALTPIYRAWDYEYQRTDGAILRFAVPVDSDAHEWFFDGTEHVDPMKEAGAEKTRLANGTITYREVYARKGQDWRAAFKQRAEEQQLADQLGLKLGEQPQQDNKSDTTDDTEDEEEQGDGKNASTTDRRSA